MIVSDAVTLRLTALEVLHLAPGLTTVMLKVPGWRISLSLIVAVKTDGEDGLNVVFRFELLRRILESSIKLDPLTVSVKSGPPSRTDAGFKELMKGTGLLMLNETAGEVSVGPRSLNSDRHLSGTCLGDIFSGDYRG